MANRVAEEDILPLRKEISEMKETIASLRRELEAKEEIDLRSGRGTDGPKGKVNMREVDATIRNLEDEICEIRELCGKANSELLQTNKEIIGLLERGDKRLLEHRKRVRDRGRTQAHAETRERGCALPWKYPMGKCRCFLWHQYH